MKVTVVLASGKEILFECEEAEVKKNGYGDISGLTLTGIKGQNFLWIRLNNVDAVLFTKESE